MLGSVQYLSHGLASGTQLTSTMNSWKMFTVKSLFELYGARNLMTMKSGVLSYKEIEINQLKYTG